MLLTVTCKCMLSQRDAEVPGLTRLHFTQHTHKYKSIIMTPALTAYGMQRCQGSHDSTLHTSTKELILHVTPALVGAAQTPINTSTRHLTTDSTYHTCSMIEEGVYTKRLEAGKATHRRKLRILMSNANKPD